MTDAVRAPQTTLVVAYAISWPDPRLWSAQTILAVAHTIPWPDPYVRSAQTTLLIAYAVPWGNEIRVAPGDDGDRYDVADGRGPGMLCQIIG